jgi:hypothetical protein
MLRDVGSYICGATLVVIYAARRMPTTCHHASFIDTLPLTNQWGLRSVGSLKTCHYPVTPRWRQMAFSDIQSRFKCPVAPVTPSGNRWHSVTSSWNSDVQWRQSRPVATGVCLLVAVRSHFGLCLGGRNNPDRASNRILGRRIIISLAPQLNRVSSPFPGDSEL